MTAATLEQAVADPALDARFRELPERYRAAIACLAASYEHNRAITHASHRRPHADEIEAAQDLPDPAPSTEQVSQCAADRERLRAELTAATQRASVAPWRPAAFPAAFVMCPDRVA